jgi:PAS domain S-box-containing protein
MEYHDLPETMPLLEELNMAIKGAKISHNTLKQMEEIFYKAFRYSPILKIIFSLKDKRVFEVNEELLRVMGFKRDELIGRTPEEFMHSSGNEPLSEFCHNTFEKRIMRKNVNMPFSTRYGESREGFFSTEIIHIGHEPYVFMVCVDITDINKMEKEMAQLEKLNLLGQMAASIGHEIRNPMTAIRGFLQLLQRKERYSEDEQFLKLMISEVDRANAIITDFLSLAGKKTGEKTLLDLNIIIKSLFPLLQAQAIKEDKKVELCLKDLPLYMFNENEMKQVILNLVNNALDALGPGGLVRISTRQVEPEGTVIVLMVEDNGCGIPEEIMSRLGTPFTTTKEKGTGLGLAVCYDIVEKHHGQIQVETNCRGTIFTILFPLSDAG